MNIQWNRIVSILLLLFALTMAIKFLPAIRAFLGSMQNIGPGHTTDDKVLGLVAIGLIGAVLVAVVRILTNNNSK